MRKRHFMKNPQITVNLQAVRSNYEIMMNNFPCTNITAVVKDNAYGIGASHVVNTLLGSGCNDFWCAYLSEAIELREKYDDCNIYFLQGFDKTDINIIKSYNIIPTINCVSELYDVLQCDLPYVLFFDTGLNRLGCRMQDMQKIASMVNPANVKYIISHFACSDIPTHKMNNEQYYKFIQLKQYFPQSKFGISSSFGAFIDKAFAFDMIRCGGMLYGIKCQTYDHPQNVVSMKASVLQQYTIQNGDAVGYGATYIASKPTKVAIVSAGYGDGIMRSLSNNGSVLFYCNDIPYKAPIIGNISMDLMACDITNIPCIDVDYATILDDNYTINDMANDAMTNPYEILINIMNGKKTIINYT